MRSFGLLAVAPFNGSPAMATLAYGRSQGNQEVYARLGFVQFA